MKFQSLISAGVLSGVCLTAFSLATRPLLRPVPASASPVPASPIRWKKTVIDPRFRSEGVAVGDVNRDGKLDVLAGDVWYQAPAWTMHEIRPLRDYGDGANSYSESFICFADDFNRDGWVDLMIIGMPGSPCHWYENPRNASGHWKQRLVWPSACNETPIYVELFGDGRKYLVMATQPEGQMCWFSPPADINREEPWKKHAISKPSTEEERTPGTNQFSHGLGAGDINGDGRADVIVNEGWWEQPPNARARRAAWTFHPARLSEDCADMHAADLNGDGFPDVLSSSAHRKGIWWYKRTPGKPKPFGRNVILNDFSQSHALNFVDINGDGYKDLITGKRWWAHGPTGDVEPNAPAVLYWIEIRPGPLPRFIAHRIDDSSGVGTQFSAQDINGDRRPDIVVSNKRGVHLFEQVRR